MYVHPTLFTVVLPNGTVVAQKHNPAVPLAVLEEIVRWKEEGATMNDAIDRLRLRCVPPGYTPHPWTPG